ncbi:MAG: hypothetical protein JWL77_1076 [Chthonomonadaceae bacterium]|nr:hypothetical protein [Chthonomonadaceae bacterium]
MLTGATSALSLPGLGDPPAKVILPSAVLPSTQAKKISAARDFGRLPLSFESNQGQADTRVRFLTHSADSTLFLTPNAAVFTSSAPLSAISTKRSASRKNRKKLQTGEEVAPIALQMQMVGANPKASVLQQQPLPGRVNYFLGNDPNKWHADVPTFGRVGFHGVYPGVDLIYYGNQRHLEYDFVVAPHADPKQIQLHFAGAEGLQINAVGDLVVRTAGRELKWQKPTVYQQDKTGKHAVAARFRLKRLPNGQAGVSFALGHYDRERPLTIDPVLLYSTFLGGSSTTNNALDARSIAVDGSGNAYITGVVQNNDFPTTPGALQPTNHGLGNAFVTKINSTGTALVYSTYLGGAGNPEDQGYGIAVDLAGNAYVAGETSSTDFPITSGAFQTVKHAGEGTYTSFVTKLNSTGTALLYSTYLGGTGGDHALGIALDSSNHAYVTGYASSADFPTTPGAFQRVKNVPSTFGPNAFVTKLNTTGTALLYSTYIGGSTGDIGYAIAVDHAGDAYITGRTASTDFPTTPGAFQIASRTPTGGYSGFVTKLNPNGTALLYSTYLGGNDFTRGAAIAVDSLGDAYVTGPTSAADFPTTPGAFQQSNGGNSGFITKLNPTGTGLVYSTFLSRSAPAGIAIDSSGNAYITGDTRFPDFITTPGAFQRVQTAQGAFAAIAFVTKLNAAGSALIYSTYLGGAGDDRPVAFGIALDSSNNVYVAGSTASQDFPVTPGAFQTTNHANTAGSGANLFITKLSAIPVLPDFNNDGYTDLILQNTTTGEIGSWYLQGARQVGGALFSLTPPSDFVLVGVGDFLANGANTLVFQSRTTNEVAYWYTSGANHAIIPGGVFLNATPDPGWKVVGVGDLNSDGKSDLVFQNQTTGRIIVWFMNGAFYQGGVVFSSTPAAGWQVVGVGDFNKDGRSDLVFQNQATGQIALWYLNGTTYAGGAILTTVPAAGWKVVGVGDYNGDGSADLLFQNQTSNQAMIWYLQNGVFAGSEALSLPPPSGWKIVGPR